MFVESGIRISNQRSGFCSLFSRLKSSPWSGVFCSRFFSITNNTMLDQKSAEIQVYTAGTPNGYKVG
jgi:hypothetical protein